MEVSVFLWWMGRENVKLRPLVVAFLLERDEYMYLEVVRMLVYIPWKFSHHAHGCDHMVLPTFYKVTH